MKKTLIIISILCLPTFIHAQDSPQSMLHNTLDGKLDFSRFMIETKGFLPVMLVITLLSRL